MAPDPFLVSVATVREFLIADFESAVAFCAICYH